jgi:hypothetical protein
MVRKFGEPCATEALRGLNALWHPTQGCLRALLLVKYKRFVVKVPA